MARNKRLTVEDLWKLDRPAQPTLSPDGALACVSVTSYDMKENFVTCQYYAGKRESAYDEVRQILRQRREVAFNAPDNFALFSPDSVSAQRM